MVRPPDPPGGPPVLREALQRLAQEQLVRPVGLDHAAAEPAVEPRAGAASTARRLPPEVVPKRKPPRYLHSKESLFSAKYSVYSLSILNNV